MVPIHFWRISVTGVLPSRYSEIRGAIVRMAKSIQSSNVAVNKLFTVKNTYHDANQTDKATEQKLR